MICYRFKTDQEIRSEYGPNAQCPGNWPINVKEVFGLPLNEEFMRYFFKFSEKVNFCDVSTLSLNFQNFQKCPINNIFDIEDYKLGKELTTKLKEAYKGQLYICFHWLKPYYISVEESCKKDISKNSNVKKDIKVILPNNQKNEAN
jgi:hypothetical protein